MSELSQDGRRTGVLTTLGKDKVVLRSFTGTEAMSSLYSYRLELLSRDDTIQAADLMAQPISFWVLYPDDKPRYFHGYVSRFEYLGRGDRGSMYRIEAVPWFWFATQNRDCRIFQDLSIPQILSELFRSRGFSDFDTSNISGSYPALEYCVQYNESDYAFASRLMEEAGIFYFFQHEAGKHTMVLSDSTAGCYDCKNGSVDFSDKLSERTSSSEIWRWAHSYQFKPGRWAHEDFNFKSPQNDMVATSNTTMDLPRVTDFEVYEYPGRFSVRGDGSSIADVRMQAEESQHNVVHGAGSCRSFSPGARFTIAKHHSEREKGQSYIVTEVHHQMDGSGQFTTGGSEATAGYENDFSCVPAETQYRPIRETPVPRVQGPQTAIVVGPPGEEIYTDEFGRVKVQFHWDRYGQQNEHSSCWMRVSQVHAGKNWGMMDLPRIGEEVIVDFLNGDPDRPIITGRVYNGQNMPPFSLPAGKTRRGNMTKTYKGAGFNEMSMDDTPGQEQLRVNAMYDMNSNVNNDQTLDVGNNQTEKVAVDRTREVGNNEKVTVGVNWETSIGTDKKTTVGVSHTEDVGVSQTISVGTSQAISVGATQSTSIGSMKTESVGLMSNESVGVAKTTSVGAMHTHTVGAMLNTSVGFISAEMVGMNKTLIVGADLEQNVGGNYKLSVAADAEKSVQGNFLIAVAADIRAIARRCLGFGLMIAC